MKLIRLKKGANDFALTNLTLGQIMAIEHCLGSIQKPYVEHFAQGKEGTPPPALSPVAFDVLQGLQAMSVDSIDTFGDSHLDKVRPR